MKKLNKLSIVGYGAGDAANNLAFTTATMFLLVYYTDVAGISAAAAGTLLLVVRIFDAFADVFAGRVVDRTYSKRFGKFRPFIMFGSIPLLLLSVATFSIPELGESGTLLYAYVTYAALGLAYSLVNIPYGSLASAMTQDPAERAKLGSARMIGALLVGSALGIFVAPLIKPGADLQATFTTITLSFVVIGAALYFFTVLTAKERVYRAVPNVTFKQSMDTLKGNRPLLMLCLSSFFFLTGYLALTSVQLYYLRDVLGRLDLYPVLSIIQLVLTFVLAAFMPRLVRKLGKKRVYILSSLLTVIGGAVVFFTPAQPGLDRFHRPGGQPRGRPRSQHRGVGPRSRHGRIRRMEDRRPHRGHHIRAVLLHPQDRPGSRRRARGLRPGPRRLQVRRRPDARRRLRHPARRRRPAGGHDHPGRDRHGQVHAHRHHARPDPHRDPGPPHRRRRIVGRRPALRFRRRRPRRFARRGAVGAGQLRHPR
ncbi:sugar (glycoside-pentoside-hexuronide) transporter [Arthrobacter sp. MW3 TE3886]